MIKRFIFCVLMLNCFIFKAQLKNYFGITFGVGPSIMLNNKSLRPLLGRSEFTGINYSFKNKEQTFIFNPGLSIQLNEYNTLVTILNRAHVNQYVLNLNADILMKLSRYCLLRVGLLLNKVIESEQNISQKQANGRVYFSNSELSKGYSAADLQAGITVGLSLPFKLFRREEKFNIKMVYLASRIVNSDYHLSKGQAGEEVTVLTTKSRPLILTFGFDMSLKKEKKKKRAEDE